MKRTYDFKTIDRRGSSGSAEKGQTHGIAQDYNTKFPLPAFGVSAEGYLRGLVAYPEVRA